MLDDIKKTLWASANKLRAVMRAAEEAVELVLQQVETLGKSWA